MRRRSRPELFRPRGPHVGRQFGLEVAQIVLVLGAFAAAVLAVVQPALDEVDDTLCRRRAALMEFTELAAQVERVRGVDDDSRESELRAVERRLRTLQTDWAAAGVCDRLRPHLEMRPIGLVLTLVDEGPAVAGVIR